MENVSMRKIEGFGKGFGTSLIDHFPDGINSSNFDQDCLQLEGFKINLEDTLLLIDFLNIPNENKKLILKRIDFVTTQSFTDLVLSDNYNTILELGNCTINGKSLTQDDIDYLQALKPNWNITFYGVIEDMDLAFRNAFIRQNNLQPDVDITAPFLKNYSSFTLRSSDFGGETLKSLRYLELFSDDYITLVIEPEDWTAENYKNILDTIEWSIIGKLSKRFHIYVDNKSDGYSQGNLLEITNPNFKSIDALLYFRDLGISPNEIKQNISNLKPTKFWISNSHKAYESMSDLLKNYSPRVLEFTKIKESFRIDDFSLHYIRNDVDEIRLASEDFLNLLTSFPNGFKGLTYCNYLILEVFSINNKDVSLLVDYINAMSQEKRISLRFLKFENYESFIALADSTNDILDIKFLVCSINDNILTQEDIDALQALKPNWNITFN